MFQVTPIINMIPATSDRKVSEDLLKLWVSFATVGSPTSEEGNTWRAANHEEEFHYFFIDKYSRIEKRTELSRLKQWISI